MASWLSVSDWQFACSDKIEDFFKGLGPGPFGLCDCARLASEHGLGFIESMVAHDRSETVDRDGALRRPVGIGGSGASGPSGSDGWMQALANCFELGGEFVADSIGAARADRGNFRSAGYRDAIKQQFAQQLS